MPLKRRRGKKSIDWDEIRQKMARAELVMEEAVHPGVEKVREILAERALKLSRSPLDLETAGVRLEVLVFDLGSEQYALETETILEVFPLMDFTPLPDVPAFIVGVTHYRGEILALLDLRKLFGMEVKGVTDLSRIVVIGRERARCGILVDKAREVMFLHPDEIIPQQAYSAGPGGMGLRGVTRSALIVIDGEALLNDARLTVRQDEEAEGVP
jgi:purine-binding chemotaxis protein CheW